jgi:uncharacterized membrane protein YedE/YeeE
MDSYFTPINGLTGGALIGLSAATLLLFNGDVLGASGLMSSTILNPRKALTDRSQYWKLVLLSSFMMTARMLSTSSLTRDHRLENDSSIPVLSPFAYTLGGLLVGFGKLIPCMIIFYTSDMSPHSHNRRLPPPLFVSPNILFDLFLGTSLGNGCTSGHGVCGMARLSPRSFAAVATFITTAIITIFLISPDAAWSSYTDILRMTDRQKPTTSNNFYNNSNDMDLGLVFMFPMVAATILAPFFAAKDGGDLKEEDRGGNHNKKLVPAAIAGILFSSGLAISQMILGSKLYGFLNISAIFNSIKGGGGGGGGSTWDPTLATVLGAAVGISFLSYQSVNVFVGRFPLNAPKCFSIPTNKRIDFNLVLGSAIFGCGWGLSLLCPGPALFLAATGDASSNQSIILNWMPAFAIGSMVAARIKGLNACNDHVHI